MKWYWIKFSVFRSLWAHSQALPFCTVFFCFCATIAKLKRYHRWCGLQSLKYLPSVSLWTRFADPCSGPQFLHYKYNHGLKSTKVSNYNCPGISLQSSYGKSLFQSGILRVKTTFYIFPSALLWTVTGQLPVQAPARVCRKCCGSTETSRLLCLGFPSSAYGRAESRLTLILHVSHQEAKATCSKEPSKFSESPRCPWSSSSEGLGIPLPFRWLSLTAVTM